MRNVKRSLVSLLAFAALVMPSTGGSVAHGTPAQPTKVLIVLFDQMLPKYANQFDMPNFRSAPGRAAPTSRTRTSATWHRRR